MNSIRSCDGQRVEEEAPKKPNDDVVIDIKDDSDRSRNSKSSNTAEDMCRICHEFSESSPIIKLGCDCSGEIGFAHHECVTIWFSYKGNKVCEICGKAVKDANDDNNNNVTITTSTTTMAVLSSERPVVRVTADPSDEDNKQRRCAYVFFVTLFGVVVIVFLGTLIIL